MKRRFPARITPLTTPLSTSILHDLLLAPFGPTSGIRDILLPNKHDRRQTGEIIGRFPHPKPLILDLSQSLPVLLLPLATLLSHANILVGCKRFIPPHVPIPPTQRMRLINVWINLHHGRREE